MHTQGMQTPLCSFKEELEAFRRWPSPHKASSPQPHEGLEVIYGLLQITGEPHMNAGGSDAVKISHIIYLLLQNAGVAASCSQGNGHSSLKYMLIY